MSKFKAIIKKLVNTKTYQRWYEKYSNDAQINQYNAAERVKEQNKKLITIARDSVKNYINFCKSFPENIDCCKDKIYVIGDSHTGVFSGSENLLWERIDGLDEEIDISLNLYPLFEIFHCGPCLAYNANKENSSNRILEKTKALIEKSFLPKNATVMVVLGEIDCRVHVKKQAEVQNKSIEEIIDDILNNFEQYLLLLKEQGFNIICWGPIASQKEEAACDEFYPRYGTEIERNRINAIYNNKLALLCKKLNIKFATIFYDMLEDGYTTNSDFLSADMVHLSQKSIPTIVKRLLSEKIVKIEDNYCRIIK